MEVQAVPRTDPSSSATRQTIDRLRASLPSGVLLGGAAAENRDAAGKFIEYVSRPEVQQKWYETVSALPSVESAWESGELADDPKLALFGEQLQDAQSPPAVPTWEQVAAVIDAQIEAVVVGGADPAAAVAEMQAQAESIGTGG